MYRRRISVTRSISAQVAARRRPPYWLPFWPGSQCHDDLTRLATVDSGRVTKVWVWPSELVLAPDLQGALLGTPKPLAT